ncbi:MAG: HAD family hydrolase, partial [Anaerolineae bacterium]|nr:HAD family hydrolase [Anaerolineae bacterium]
MRYQAVIFDLFHTLISLESVGAAGPALHELLGVPPERWNPIWLKYEDGRARGRYRTNAEVLALMAPELGLANEPERWAALCAVRRGRFRRALLEVEPAVLEGLGELRARGLKLGLLSDADCEEVEAWPDSPLAAYFDRALFSCYEGLRKPEPEFYLLLCRELQVSPAACLYVGDGRSDEHLGARSVGMTPVLITHHLAQIAPERIPLM